MNNTFFIVRHGQTDWNVIGKTQGHGNSNLTKDGVEQAKSLAKFLKTQNIDYIFSSDLQRAVDTAQIVADEINLKINKIKDLREMNFGLWEGLLLDEIKNNYGESYKVWREKPHIAQIEKGETLNLIKQRTENFIKELNEKYENKNILLVSHSVTVRVMMLSFLNSGLENIYRIKQDNTAVNIVKIKSYAPVVIKMNDTSHLDNYIKTVKSAVE